MASLAALRKQAKDAGVPKPTILSATTAEELQSILTDHLSHDGETAAAPKAAPRKKAAAKTTATAPAKKNSTRAAAPAKKSDRKATSSGRKSVPARSRKSGTAKRQTTASKPSGAYVPKGGRNLLDSIDFKVTEGWNPRKGSAPDRIIAAIRSSRGNRSKAFEILKPDVNDFVGKVKRDGTKRTKAEAEAMLKYRISRTLFDFAVQTGQHEIAKNRVQYGTGGTGAGVWKPAKKTASRKTTATASKPQKRSQSRKAASTRKATSRKKTTSRSK